MNDRPLDAEELVELERAQQESDDGGDETVRRLIATVRAREVEIGRLHDGIHRSREAVETLAYSLTRELAHLLSERR